MADHEAFGDMNAKIDPNRVVTSVKDDNRVPEYREVTIVNGEAAQGFTPLQWPLFDDGKPITTNAIGYEVGGYFKRHQEAMRLAKVEAERKAEEERLAAEAAAKKAAEEEAAAAEKEKANAISLEELEAMRNAARKEGYTEGAARGHEEGYQKGFEQGKADGFNQGQQDGMAQGYQDGFRQGRDEGFTKGQESGLASGTDIVTTQADRFRHLADMLAQPLREVDEQVTDELVYLVSRMVKVIIKREIKGDVEFLKQGIEKCVSLLPEAKDGVEVELSESDYALILASVGKDYMQAQNWHVSPSTSVQDGDIVVNTKLSSAQWRIDDRIDALISDFLTGAADAVASARKESIEGCPEFDEQPKQQLIPPRDILNMSDRIAKNMAAMAPQPPKFEPAAGDGAVAEAAKGIGTLAPESAGVDFGDAFDPDAAEIHDATLRSQTDEALAANAFSIDQGSGPKLQGVEFNTAAIDAAKADAEAHGVTPPPSIAEQAAAAAAAETKHA